VYNGDSVGVITIWQQSRTKYVGENYYQWKGL